MRRYTGTLSQFENWTTPTVRPDIISEPIVEETVTKTKPKTAKRVKINKRFLVCILVDFDDVTCKNRTLNPLDPNLKSARPWTYMPKRNKKLATRLYEKGFEKATPKMWQYLAELHIKAKEMGRLAYVFDKGKVLATPASL